MYLPLANSLVSSVALTSNGIIGGNADFTYDLDSAGNAIRPTQIHYNKKSNHIYNYDNIGRVTTIVTKHNGGTINTTSFKYNANNLISVRGSDILGIKSKEVYSYDSKGLLTTEKSYSQSDDEWILSDIKHMHYEEGACFYLLPQHIFGENPAKIQHLCPH